MLDRKYKTIILVAVALLVLAVVFYPYAGMFLRRGSKRVSIRYNIKDISTNISNVFKMQEINGVLYGDNAYELFTVNKKTFSVDKVLWKGSDATDAKEIPFVGSDGFIFKIYSVEKPSAKSSKSMDYQKLIVVNLTSNKVRIFNLPYGMFVKPYQGFNCHRNNLVFKDGILFINADGEFCSFSPKTGRFGKILSAPIVTFSVVPLYNYNNSKILGIYAITEFSAFTQFSERFIKVTNGDASIYHKYSCLCFPDKMYWIKNNEESDKPWRMIGLKDDSSSEQMLFYAPPFSSGDFFSIYKIDLSKIHGDGILTPSKCISVPIPFSSSSMSPADMISTDKYFLISLNKQSEPGKYGMPELIIVNRNNWAYLSITLKDKDETFMFSRIGKGEFVLTAKNHIYRISLIDNN